MKKNGENILPNTFLIGVQKAATSSLYNWISQHPEVCGPESLKDIPFFFDDNLYNKGNNFLTKVYRRHFTGEKIILQGNVNYIFFKKALIHIQEFNPYAKFILVLRNPIDRAVSAYNYSVQRGIESRQITTAFSEENSLMQTHDLIAQSDFGYKAHGLYYKQISQFLEYFKREQLCILFFEDLKNNPQHTLKEVYNFLGIDANFEAALTHVNETGAPKNKLLLKTIYSENKLKKLFMEKVVDRLFSLDLKVKLKLYVTKLFTNTNKKNKAIVPKNLKLELESFYKDDISKLEVLLGKDLSHWKE